TSLDSAADITGTTGVVSGSTVSLVAAGGISGPVKTASTSTLTLTTSGAGAAGNISISEANALDTTRLAVTTAGTAQTISITDTAAGGITVGGNFTASGADNLTLNASAGSIIGGAGRITTTGAVILSGTGVGTAAAPLLTNLGGSGTINITSTGANAAGDIAFSDNNAAAFKDSQITGIVTAGATPQTVTVKTTGAGGYLFDQNGIPAASNDNGSIVATAGSVDFGTFTVGNAGLTGSTSFRGIGIVQ